MDKQIRIAVRLDAELKEAFYKACKEKAVNPSELVRQLIQKWMQDNKDK